MLTDSQIRVMNIHPGTMNTSMYKIAYEGGLKFVPNDSECFPLFPLRLLIG